MSKFKGEIVPRDRRISIICRSEPDPNINHDDNDNDNDKRRY